MQKIKVELASHKTFWMINHRTTSKVHRHPNLFTKEMKHHYTARVSASSHSSKPQRQHNNITPTIQIMYNKTHTVSPPKPPLALVSSPWPFLTNSCTWHWLLVIWPFGLMMPPPVEEAARRRGGIGRRWR